MLSVKCEHLRDQCIWVAAVTADVLCASELAGGVEVGEYFMQVLRKQCQSETFAALRRLILAMFI